MPKRVHPGDNEQTGDQYSEDDGPNVVKLTLPTNHRDESAAWLYVPSKDTIYIGDYGTNAIDLADTLKHVIDVKKGEKLVSGIMDPDGYIDYFQATDRDGAILKSLQNYHSLSTDSGSSKHDDGYSSDDMGVPDYDKNLSQGDVHYFNGEAMVFDEKSQDWIPEEDYYEQLMEDGDDDSPSFATQDHQKLYQDLHDKWNDWKGKPDRDDIDPTTAPLGERTDEWNQDEYKAWADQRKNEDYSHSWSPRESKPHFRWSFGDRSIAPEAPHEGLFMWPVKNGYPDHFSQTGWKGLGWCAQGRVYPHTGDRYEVLTWPNRPRHLNDPNLARQYKDEAAQAAKDWVIENLGADPDKIYFTEGQYGDMVSNWHSPTYPDIGRTDTRTIRYDDTDGSAYYDVNPGDEYVDENDEVNVGPGWNKPPVIDDHGVSSQPGRKPTDSSKIIEKVLEARGGERPPEVSEAQWYYWTPEERYEYKVNKFNADQEGHRNSINDAYQYDPLRNMVNGVPYKDWAQQQQQMLTNPPPAQGEPYTPGMGITDRSGNTTVITPEEYEAAYAEYGDQWWRKWLPPKESAVA